ncbi:tRNA pseudouridine(13) synthase TruD [Streptomyces sp. NPDC056831]|uniref:tRNA pseudouridine(13) synthase TruD n=1 Tax=Streptomyces sp. NPDC056831 TaxID=3345954 RepID=UPI0036B9A9BA
MTSDGPCLKQRPGDFLVRENLLVPLIDPGEATHHHLLMRKCGFTTFEAMRLLANQLGCDSEDITYAGLKDEDGVTEQLVAVPMRAANGVLGAGTVDIVPMSGTDCLSVQHYGYSNGPLRVGRLEGNTFRIVVRNLDVELACQLEARRRISFCALNYYDTQRFGVPCGPKLTHVLGRHLLKREWQEAFDVLLRLGAPETCIAQQWQGSPEEFFTKALERRVANFYLSAWASHEWNRTLSDLVREVADDEVYAMTVNGITYDYLRTSQAAAQVLARTSELDYRRLTFGSEAPETSSPRATVVQVALQVDAAQPDDAHPGRAAVTLCFALPSGCYATGVIRQLLTPFIESVERQESAC